MIAVAEELSGVAKYLRTCISDLEHLLCRDDSDEIQIGLACQNMTTISLALQEKPQIAMVDDILDGDWDDDDSNGISFGKPKCQRFILWRIIYLIRVFECIESPEVFRSSISPLCLSIVR